MLKKNWLLVFFLAIVAFIIFSWFLNRGITFYDEGYILESSYLVYLGKVPYRDFHFQYTPLTVWLGSLWFKLFGVGILKLRWLALLVSVGTVITGFLIAKSLSGGILGPLTALALIFWTFPHANFLWPSHLSLFFFVLLLLLLIYFYKTKKLFYIFLAGVSAGLNILSKQNLGIASLIGFGITAIVATNKKDRTKIIYFYYGAFIIFLLGVFVVSLKNPIFMGISKFISRSLAIGRGEALFRPYPFLSKPIWNFGGVARWFGKMFIYNLAPISLIFGLYLWFKDKLKDNLLKAVFILTQVHYWASSWPTADLAHVAFGIPAIILLFASWRRLKLKYLRTLSIFVVALLMLIGVYKAFFMRYYTFEAPYREQKIATDIEGEELLLEPKTAIVMNKLSKMKPDVSTDNVFVHSYAPLVYFILDKVPSTGELYTVEWLLNRKDQEAVVERLKTEETNLIFFEAWREKDSKSLINRYIKDNYEKIGKLDGFEIFER